MSEPLSTNTARALLAAAVTRAEQALLKLIAAGQLPPAVVANPYTLLVALTTTAAAVMEGGAVEVALGDLLHLMDFIATDPAYTPGPRFPFTKAQLAAALSTEA